MRRLVLVPLVPPWFLRRVPWSTWSSILPILPRFLLDSHQPKKNPQLTTHRLTMGRRYCCILRWHSSTLAARAIRCSHAGRPVLQNPRKGHLLKIERVHLRTPFVQWTGYFFLRKR